MAEPSKKYGILVELANRQKALVGKSGSDARKGLENVESVIKGYILDKGKKFSECVKTDRDLSFLKRKLVGG